ncbi:mannosyltransferase [Cryptotrichosporon argae]
MSTLDNDEPLTTLMLDRLAGSPVLLISALAALVFPPIVALFLCTRHVAARPFRHRSATVLVLGDLGRSPRMMYHSESLAKAGWETFAIGYGDTTPIPALLETPLVHLLHLHNPPSLLLRLPWVLRAPIRILTQITSVLYLCLIKVPVRTEVLLVQNPPSIPTLALAQLVAKISGSKLIIDWHNTGHSILALRVGAQSPLVSAATWFEKTYGRHAYAHLFVTDALRAHLSATWGLQGIKAVLHDRPPAHFRRTEPLINHELFRRLVPTLEPPLPAHLSAMSPAETPFTIVHSHLATLRPTRPALIVSSTSWTTDEDFSLLLTALDAYQTVKSQQDSAALPTLVVIITGRGALRPAFEAAVARREASGTWRDVVVRCTFVAARDYPLVLGCADVGVSLHQSSSGRDLPMKVVDMFGCGVPVLARKFACIAELVRDGVNGRVFDTGEQLGQQLVESLTGFPAAPALDRLRAYFDKHDAASPGRALHVPGKEAEWTTWDQNWDDVMRRDVLDFRRHRRD